MCQGEDCGRVCEEQAAHRRQAQQARRGLFRERTCMEGRLQRTDHSRQCSWSGLKLTSIFVLSSTPEGRCQPCVSLIRYHNRAAFLSLRRATHNLPHRPREGAVFLRSLHQALVSGARSRYGLRRSDPRRLRWKRDSTCPRHDRRRGHCVLTTGIITGSVQQKQAKRAGHCHDGGNAHGSQILLVLGHGGQSSPECLGGIVSARKG
jgi:hypothetical protein